LIRDFGKQNTRRNVLKIVGEVSRVKMMRRRGMQRRLKVPKIFFGLPQKQQQQQKNQIDVA